MFLEKEGCHGGVGTQETKDPMIRGVVQCGNHKVHGHRFGEMDPILGVVEEERRRKIGVQMNVFTNHGYLLHMLVEDGKFHAWMLAHVFP
jgi:hypothetical protein